MDMMGGGDVQMSAEALATLERQAWEHVDCDDQFCRNGTAPGEKLVHPGPCRGWKDALRRQAPGVHRALEAVRQQRLAERRAARGSAPAATGDGARVPNRGQLSAIEDIGRAPNAGRHPRTVSPQMRRNLIEGGWVEERQSRGADGRDAPALFLTERGQAIVGARQAARDEATRRIEEQAIAEGLDPMVAKTFGIPAARESKAKREEAEVRARRNEAERGAPPAPGDTAGMGAGYNDPNHSKAVQARAKLTADMIKAAGGLDNVTMDQRQRANDAYGRYVRSYAEVDGHRRHVQAWADRLAYLNDSRDLHGDPAVRADIDRLAGEARAGYDKAAADLAEAGERAEAAREAAAEAIVSIYREHGKRKSVAALKLPPAPDATPPEAKVRLAAEVDRVVRQAGGGEVPDNAPERRAVERAAVARVRQDAEIEALKKDQERNRRDREYEISSRRSGNRNEESDARLAALDADGSRIVRDLQQARNRLVEFQDAERVASNQLRQHVAAVKERERARARGAEIDDMQAGSVAVTYRNASERLGRDLSEGERNGVGNRLRGMIDSGADPALIISEARKEARRAESAARGGDGYQSPSHQDSLLRAARAYEAVARMIRESGATSNDDIDPSRGGAGDTPVHRGALERLREGFDGIPAGQAAELQALIVAGDDPAHIAREARRLAEGMDLQIRQASRSRTQSRLRVQLLREQQAYEGVARAMEGRDAPEPAATPRRGGDRFEVNGVQFELTEGRGFRRDSPVRYSWIIPGVDEGAERQFDTPEEAVAHARRVAAERNANPRRRRIEDGPPEGQFAATGEPSSALVASLESMVRQHIDCDDDFCRNGTAPGEKLVHPGPCRGWKDTLRRVAPGAYEIVESERRRRLAERRAGRERDRPAPGPPPVRVELSQETRDQVARVAAMLPRDEAGWHALTGRELGTPTRRVDTNIADARAQLPAAREAHARALIAARDVVRKERHTAAARRRKTLTPEEEDRAQRMARFSFDLGGRDLADVEARIAHWESVDREIKEAKANGIPLTDSQRYDDATVMPDPTITSPRDANGAIMPPAGLAAVEREVTAAGFFLQGDINRAFNADPEVTRLRDESDARVNVILNGETPEIRRAARQADRVARAAINRRRREITLAALSQLRPMGGERHTRVQPLDAAAVMSGTHAGQAARADWRARLDVSDQHFPDDWTRVSARSNLQVQSSDRAFYSEGSAGWETTVEGERGGTMAMNTDNNVDTVYQGGFADYVDEVTVHEMGHRMEQQIPGVRALEFAWVRARTTARVRDDGTPELEPVRRLIDLHPNSGYEDHETARPDEFANAYAGREYLPSDPGGGSWEAFQVGLQEVYGGSRSFGPPDGSLRAFTLGVLATVGRTS